MRHTTVAGKDQRLQVDIVLPGGSDPQRQQPEAADDATTQELFAEAHKRGLLLSPTHACSIAVDSAITQLKSVEDHLEPQAFANVMSLAPTTRAAVHVASVAEAAWCKVPSEILGPRPTWMQPSSLSSSSSSRRWSYAALLSLCVKVGISRVRKALEQSCEQEALLMLLPSTEREKVEAALHNVSRISGLDLKDLLERRGASYKVSRQDGSDESSDGWGEGLGSVPFSTSQIGFKVTSEWDERSAVEGQLLELSLIKNTPTLGQGFVLFDVPSQRPSQADLSQSSFFDPSWYQDLLPWADVEGAKALRVPGWGHFDAEKELREALDRDPSSLPSPEVIRASGYTSKLFSGLDEFSKQRITRTFMMDPSSPLSRYIKRWAEDLKDGTLAARIDKMEDFDLGDESVASLPPHTLMRRTEQERKLPIVPFERIEWLADGQSHVNDGDGHHEDVPQVLYEYSDGMKVLLLTSSHQITLAGEVLKNCAEDYVGRVQQ